MDGTEQVNASRPVGHSLVRHWLVCATNRRRRTLFTDAYSPSHVDAIKMVVIDVRLTFRMSI